MPTTDILPTGVAVLLLAAVSTAVITAFLLRRYRSATLAAMARSAGAAADPRPAERSVAPPRRALQVDAVAPGSAPGSGGAARRAGRVYAVAGLLYAVIITLVWMISAGGGFPLGRFLWLLACFCWPVAVVLDWTVVADRPGRIRVYSAYWLLVATLLVFTLLRNPDLTVSQAVFLWLILNGPATALMLAFNRRRVRAVGPIVLAFMAAGLLGAFLFLALVTATETGMRILLDVGVSLGLGATSFVVLVSLSGFVVVGALGWALLARLGRAYRAKRFSDQTLTVQSSLLVFAIAQSITLAFDNAWWILSGLAAFLVFNRTTRWGLAAIDHPARGPQLLLLRVFALGRRSERLYDSLSQDWRRLGPMHLIAGPDLATSTLEPHEFLDYVGGRLSRAFVSGEADLEERVEALDLAPDPDGRFRVNEFFCRADTWKPTMSRLAGLSDAVLMDLRSFTPANRGCLFEIEQLVHHVELDRVLLLVDASTDRAFLDRELATIWSRLAPESPNRALDAPRIRLYDSGAGRTAVRPLVAALTGG